MKSSTYRRLTMIIPQDPELCISIEIGRSSHPCTALFLTPFTTQRSEGQLDRAAKQIGEPTELNI